MNTKTGLIALALTATLFTAAACGSDQPQGQPAGGAGEAAEAAAEAARVARADDAYARRMAHGAAPAVLLSCRVSPDGLDRMLQNGERLPACVARHNRLLHLYGDDRRTSR